MYKHKPKIVISRCYIDPVRYDGNKVNETFVHNILKFVEYIPICPEVEIGLGVPRDKIFLIKKDTYRIYQNGNDITDKMEIFSENFLRNIGNIDGFLLKGKSPSCGVTGAKTYKKNDGSEFIGRRSGIFVRKVRNYFPHLPIEDEIRLKGHHIKISFLLRIFLYSTFKSWKDKKNFIKEYEIFLRLFNEKFFKEFSKEPSEKNIRNILKRNLSKERAFYILSLIDKKKIKSLPFPLELIK